MTPPTKRNGYCTQETMNHDLKQGVFLHFSKFMYTDKNIRKILNSSIFEKITVFKKYMM